jgi:hypothetical protein
VNEEPPPPAKVDLRELFLTVVVGVTLTYFFFTPGKEAISGFVKSLLPSGW